MKGCVIISNKRLKLYDSSIEIVIDKKTKEKFRKIAYKEKITMSDYIRKLINLVICYNEINKLDSQFSNSIKELNNSKDLLGDIDVFE